MYFRRWDLHISTLYNSCIPSHSPPHHCHRYQHHLTSDNTLTIPRLFAPACRSMAGIRAGRVTVDFSEDELTDLEAGIGASGSWRNLHLEQLHHQKYDPPPAVLMGGFGAGRNFYGRRGYRSIVGSFCSPSSRGGSGRFFYDPRCEDEGSRGYFLDACALCKKSLAAHRDIYMYRGDTPFCSEECRQDQIEMDEAKEKKLRNVAVKASSRNEPKTNTAQGTIHVHAVGATVAG